MNCIACFCSLFIISYFQGKTDNQYSQCLRVSSIVSKVQSDFKVDNSFEFCFHRKKKEQMKNNMKSHRKEGKVYTFRQDEDDDKEDKTWNGNSTQQM